MRSGRPTDSSGRTTANPSSYRSSHPGGERIGAPPSGTRSGKPAFHAKRRSESTSDRILEAATHLFFERGYHATTMRQVADRVGIKAGSLYNHFPSKQDLLYRITSVTMQEMLEAAQTAVSAAHTHEDKLRAFVRTHVLYSIVRREQASVADEQLRGLEPDNRAAVTALRDEYEKVLKDIIQAGKDSAGWRVRDVPIITFALASMASAVYTWYRTEGRLSPDAVADIYADLALDAVSGA